MLNESLVYNNNFKNEDMLYLSQSNNILSDNESKS